MKKPNVFILDVDGVMTNGQFLYSSEGKVLKVFGPDDNDALSLLRPYLEIQFVTGDKRGFTISKRRIVDDMHYDLQLVSTFKRAEWIAARYTLEQVIYMGDGIFDHMVMNKVLYSIAPSNADPNAIKAADYVTHRAGAERAVSEACMHILNRFFVPYDLSSPDNYENLIKDQLFA